MSMMLSFCLLRPYIPSKGSKRRPHCIRSFAKAAIRWKGVFPLSSFFVTSLASSGILRHCSNALYLYLPQHSEGHSNLCHQLAHNKLDNEKQSLSFCLHVLEWQQCEVLFSSSLFQQCRPPTHHILIILAVHG